MEIPIEHCGRGGPVVSGGWRTAEGASARSELLPDSDIEERDRDGDLGRVSELRCSAVRGPVGAPGRSRRGR
jgi:hypothetical protein